MQRDIRGSELYAAASTFYESVRRAGTGRISEAAEVHVSPDGKQAVFAGTLLDALEGAPPTRICLTQLQTGETRVISYGPQTDRLPKFSPQGGQVAFLSDRHRAGDFQLYLLDPVSGAVSPTPAVAGWVEYLHWSPDGKRILLGVAGHGADIAGTHGAVTSRKLAEDVPSWMPGLETGEESNRWRRAWVYEVESGQVRQVTRSDSNVWEAVWCGNERLAAVVSGGPGEGLWYEARLHVVELDTGASREMYAPEDQIGWPAASPSGRRLVFAEAVCSDRWIVAGDLRLMDLGSGKIQRIDTRGVNITTTEWRSEECLLLAGLRGFETVVGLYDVACGEFTEVWASREISTMGSFINVSGFNERGDCVLVGEGFKRAPEIGEIREGTYRTVKSFDVGYGEQAQAIEAVEEVSWQAPDGWEIQGWLLRPVGRGPYPLVMYVHGGPVSNWRPVWLGRPRGGPIWLLVKRGYAVFLPNPRGSSGRGQEFARGVLGDMGGADAQDCLSGLDYLVKQGIADAQRLGVAGVSYGGYMTAWLITQDARFAAAVVVSPTTNRVSAYLLSNIPQFTALFLADDYSNAAGRYHQRSPVMHARKAKTPTLNVCGALDRCTPPEEAMQFHNALRESGVESVLATYPQEGHGIRKFPAAIDFTARLVAWFEAHMPTTPRK